MKYISLKNCRLADEIAYKAGIHPSELSNLFKSEMFSHLIPSHANIPQTIRFIKSNFIKHAAKIWCCNIAAN
jgi:hypothetical protein